MKTRIISAAVLIVIALPCLLLSEFTRVLLFGVAGVLCAWEYRMRLKEKGIHVTGWVMYTFLAIQVFLTLTHSLPMSYMAWFTASIFISLFSGVLHRDVSGEGALYTLAGLSYPCFPFAIAMIISVSDRWGITLALGILSSIMSDSFALFGGKLFGKHKVAPHVSPNKSVEGCAFGVLSSLLTGSIVYLFFRNTSPISLFQCLLTSFVCSVLGEIGDLAESLLKRYLDIKDFSNLIPGHGGIFDRIDNMMFSIPAAYFCLYIMGL